ncbi:hypothetical protein C5167_028418 [Papaver somniferum]|nr:hypothetical protein C5167_028418 [Papaver somniferum]
MNELPTIFEVVSGAVKKQQVKEKSSVSNHSNNKSKPISQKSYSKPNPPPIEDEEQESDKEEDEHGVTLCGACDENDASDLKVRVLSRLESHPPSDAKYLHGILKSKGSCLLCLV